MDMADTVSRGTDHSGPVKMRPKIKANPSEPGVPVACGFMRNAAVGLSPADGAAKLLHV